MKNKLLLVAPGIKSIRGSKTEVLKISNGHLMALLLSKNPLKMNIKFKYSSLVI